MPHQTTAYSSTVSAVDLSPPLSTVYLRLCVSVPPIPSHMVKTLTNRHCTDSGHGAQRKDKDGDEQDGLDEVIFPLDFRKYGHIVDDEMFDIMVRPLPEGCRLTALYDVRSRMISAFVPYQRPTCRSIH
jgi:hypothetical protein